MTDMRTKFMQEGRDAYVRGVPLEDCPYPEGSATADAWHSGWIEMNHNDPLLEDDERIDL